MAVSSDFVKRALGSYEKVAVSRSGILMGYSDGDLYVHSNGKVIIKIGAEFYIEEIEGMTAIKEDFYGVLLGFSGSGNGGYSFYLIMSGDNNGTYRIPGYKYYSNIVPSMSRNGSKVFAYLEDDHAVMLLKIGQDGELVEHTYECGSREGYPNGWVVKDFGALGICLGSYGYDRILVYGAGAVHSSKGAYIIGKTGYTGRAPLNDRLNITTRGTRKKDVKWFDRYSPYFEELKWIKR
jgi:hypothetical protein